MPRVLKVLFVGAAVAFGTAPARLRRLRDAGVGRQRVTDVWSYVLHVGTQSGSSPQQVYVGNVTWSRTRTSTTTGPTILPSSAVGQPGPIQRLVARGRAWSAGGSRARLGQRRYADVVWQHDGGWRSGAWTGVNAQRHLDEPEMVSDPDWQISPRRTWTATAIPTSRGSTGRWLIGLAHERDCVARTTRR